MNSSRSATLPRRATEMFQRFICRHSTPTRSHATQKSSRDVARTVGELIPRILVWVAVGATNAVDAPPAVAMDQAAEERSGLAVEGDSGLPRIKFDAALVLDAALAVGNE